MLCGIVLTAVCPSSGSSNIIVPPGVRDALIAEIMQITGNAFTYNDFATSLFTIPDWVLALFPNFYIKWVGCPY